MDQPNLINKRVLLSKWNVESTKYFVDSSKYFSECKKVHLKRIQKQAYFYFCFAIRFVATYWNYATPSSTKHSTYNKRHEHKRNWQGRLKHRIAVATGLVRYRVGYYVYKWICMYRCGAPLERIGLIRWCG